MECLCLGYLTLSLPRTCMCSAMQIEQVKCLVTNKYKTDPLNLTQDEMQKGEGSFSLVDVRLQKLCWINYIFLLSTVLFVTYLFKSLFSKI